jgi:hypothetical protein
LAAAAGKKGLSDFNLMVAQAVLLEVGLEKQDLLLGKQASRDAVIARLAAAGITGKSFEEVQHFIKLEFRSTADVQASVDFVESFAKRLSASKMVRKVQQELDQNDPIMHGRNFRDRFVGNVTASTMRYPTVLNPSVIAATDKRINEVTGEITAQVNVLAEEIVRVRNGMVTRGEALQHARFEDMRGQTKGLRSNRMVVRALELDKKIPTLSGQAAKDAQIELDGLLVALRPYSTEKGYSLPVSKAKQAVLGKDSKKDIGKLRKVGDRAQRIVDFLELQRAQAHAEREVVALEKEYSKLRALQLEAQKDASKSLVKGAIRAVLAERFSDSKDSVRYAAIFREPQFAEELAKIRGDVMKLLGAHAATYEEVVDAELFQLSKDGESFSADTLAKWQKEMPLTEQMAALAKQRQKFLKDNPPVKALTDRLAQEKHARDAVDSLTPGAKYEIRFGKAVGIAGKVPVDPSGQVNVGAVIAAAKEDTLTVYRDQKGMYSVAIAFGSKIGVGASFSLLQNALIVDAKASAGKTKGLKLDFATQAECTEFVTSLMTGSAPAAKMLHAQTVFQAQSGSISLGAQAQLTFPQVIPDIKWPDSVPYHDQLPTGVRLGAVAAAAGLDSTWSEQQSSRGLVRTKTRSVSVELGIRLLAADAVTASLGSQLLATSQITGSGISAALVISNTTRQAFQYGRVTTDTTFERSVAVGSRAGTSLSLILPNSVGGVAEVTALAGSATAEDTFVVRHRLKADAALQINKLLSENNKQAAEAMLGDIDGCYEMETLTLLKGTQNRSELGLAVGVLLAQSAQAATQREAFEVDLRGRSLASAVAKV